MVIRIDTAEVKSTGGQFHSKRGELESLVQQANTMMNNLQGQFTGQRADRIFGEWNEMQGNLQNAIQSLQAAGDLLNRASDDFAQADSAI